MYRARWPVHLPFCRSLSPSLTRQTGSSYSPSDSSSSSSASRARTSNGSGNESRSAIATPTHPSLSASLCLTGTRCQTCISRCKNRPHECECGWTASSYWRPVIAERFFSAFGYHRLSSESELKVVHSSSEAARVSTAVPLCPLLLPSRSRDLGASSNQRRRERQCARAHWL